MFILNSLKVAAVVMVGQCIIDTMMAYAFARIEFKGREALIYSCIGRTDGSVSGFDYSAVYDRKKAECDEQSYFTGSSCAYESFVGIYDQTVYDDD